jgi:hypothetical protein
MSLTSSVPYSLSPFLRSPALLVSSFFLLTILLFHLPVFLFVFLDFFHFSFLCFFMLYFLFSLSTFLDDSLLPPFLHSMQLRAQFAKAGNHLGVTVSFQCLQVSLHTFPQRAARAADAKCIHHRLLA